MQPPAVHSSARQPQQPRHRLPGRRADADQRTDPVNPAGTIKLAEANVDVPEQLAARAKAGDWTKPAAMAIPKEGYFKVEQGRYGPIFPKTLANYGFTIIAKIKPGREEAVRAYGKNHRDGDSAAIRTFSPRSGFIT